MLFYLFSSVLAIEERYFNMGLQAYSAVPENEALQKEHFKEAKNSMVDNDVKVKENGSKEQEKHETFQQTPSRLLRSQTGGERYRGEISEVIYDNPVWLNENNEVIIRASGSIIYAQVTDACEMRDNSRCRKISCNEQGCEPSFIEDSQIKLAGINPTGYSGRYKIRNNIEGYVTISVYVMTHGLIGYCYKGPNNFTGQYEAKTYPDSIKDGWTDDLGCWEGTDMISVKLMGKLFIPEEGLYKFILESIGDCHLTINDNTSIKTPEGFVTLSKLLTEGYHDFLIICPRQVEEPTFSLLWITPSSDNKEIGIQLNSLRYVTSMFVSEKIKVTCDKGYHLPKTKTGRCVKCPPGQYNDLPGQDKCRECPRGTYADDEEPVSCKKCPKGTYNDRTGQYGISNCTVCEKMTYNEHEGALECKPCLVGTYSDDVGATHCSNCHPLCKACFGPSNTQCLSCTNTVDLETCGCSPEAYGDNSICQLCSNACLGCYGPTNSDCIKCNTPEGYLEGNLGKCHLKICADGTYFDTERAQCSICGSLCKSCDGKDSCVECVSEVSNSIANDENVCSLCPDGYEYKLNKCKGNL